MFYLYVIKNFLQYHILKIYENKLENHFIIKSDNILNIYNSQFLWNNYFILSMFILFNLILPTRFPLCWVWLKPLRKLKRKQTFYDHTILACKKAT